jgi:hypothetical protein
MVGMFISLVVVLAVYGSASFFETNRRQMIGGNMAFENAMAGLLAMQRSARQAGLSIALDGRLACESVNIFRDGVVRANAAPVAPVRIVAGGDDSDTLTVAFADSLQAAMPAQSIRPMAAGDTVVLTSNALGLNVDDLVLMGTPGAGTPCTLMQISAIEPSVSPPGARILHQGATAWNPVDRTASFATMPAYPTGSLVQRVGAWNWLSYRVVAGRLEELDNTTGAVNVLADDIVYLKAAYGTTDGINRTIEHWALPTGAWADPSVTQLNAVRAVHLALVARNPQRVKPSVTGGACDASVEPLVELWPDGPLVDLTRLGDDWGCFTYRTLRLVVPLRNVIFGA